MDLKSFRSKIRSGDKNEEYSQVTIKIELSGTYPQQFFVNIESEGKKLRSQVCDSADEVREFVSGCL
jgi:hypothetical protein